MYKGSKTDVYSSDECNAVKINLRTVFGSIITLTINHIHDIRSSVFIFPLSILD